MWSRLLALALLLLPAPALAGVKEKVAALTPSALVLMMDAEGNELVAQNADDRRRSTGQRARRAIKRAPPLQEGYARSGRSLRRERGEQNSAE